MEMKTLFFLLKKNKDCNVQRDCLNEEKSVL
jgi:hypothetical protein